MDLSSMNNLQSLIVGGMGTTAVATYLGVSPLVAITGTTVGGYVLNKIIEKKNDYSAVNFLENGLSKIKRTIGFSHCSLILDEDSLAYTKFLAYVVEKFKTNLINNNSDYHVNNQVKLSELIFDIVLTDIFLCNGILHDILISFDKNSDKLDIITLKSRTLTISQLNSYVKHSIMSCTNRSSIVLYQPTITRAQERSDRNDDKSNHAKTTVKWSCFYIHTNKNIQNTIVSKQVREEFLDDIHFFINNEDHYNSKGIPYKRGYLLHGPPGTGKTSLIKAIASTYGMDVYLINMGEIKTSDDITKIFNGFRNTGNYHIVCFEDIDRSDMFKKMQNKWNVDNDALRTLLNELDGIVEGNKRIMLFTANDTTIIDSIDALCRPGRIDKKIKIDYCTKEQICDLYNHYTTSNKTIKTDEIKDDVDNITPAHVIKILLKTPNIDEKNFIK